jgi:radical SAM protein with 4Fe4S-binding SPASM domain
MAQVDEVKVEDWLVRFRDYEEHPLRNSFPARVTIELTNLCNLECRMCPRKRMTGPQGHMDFGLYRSVVDEVVAHSADTKVVLFFRGESLMHPLFKQMLKYARDCGLWNMSLATNAMLLDEGMSDFILEAGLKFISFSIDCREHYRQQRVGADFDRVVGNIDYFIRRRAELGLKLPETQVSLVETDVSTSEVGDFVGFWLPKVDRVRIYKEHSRSGGFGAGVDNSGEVSFPRRLPCPKVINDIVIYWNGEVAICNHDWDRTDRIGDVQEDSIEQVWANERYDSLRRHHIRNELADERPCDKCDYWRTFYLDTGMFGSLFTKAQLSGLI